MTRDQVRRLALGLLLAVLGFLLAVELLRPPCRSQNDFTEADGEIQRNRGLRR